MSIIFNTDLRDGDDASFSKARRSSSGQMQRILRRQPFLCTSFAPGQLAVLLDAERKHSAKLNRPISGKGLVSNPALLFDRFGGPTSHAPQLLPFCLESCAGVRNLVRFAARNFFRDKRQGGSLTLFSFSIIVCRHRVAAGPQHGDVEALGSNVVLFFNTTGRARVAPRAHVSARHVAVVARNEGHLVWFHWYTVVLDQNASRNASGCDVMIVLLLLVPLRDGIILLRCIHHFPDLWPDIARARSLLSLSHAATDDNIASRCAQQLVEPRLAGPKVGERSGIVRNSTPNVIDRALIGVLEIRSCVCVCRVTSMLKIGSGGGTSSGSSPAMNNRPLGTL